MDLLEYLPTFSWLIFVLDFIIILFTIPWILAIKKNSTSAIAWCLIVIFLPIIGFLLFIVLGYNYVYRPLRRKRRHRSRFRSLGTKGSGRRRKPSDSFAEPEATWQNLGSLALKFGDFPMIPGNEVTLYHDTERAFAEMEDAIRDARKHIHLEYYIVRPDDTTKRLFQLLEQKAKEGVEVRLLYDAVGSVFLKGRVIRPLLRAGVKCAAFLTLNPFRRRFQINMRNHRKLTVVDGQIAFMGGMNIGDEYLSKDPHHGYWREAFLRLEGPAVARMQEVFIEDWDFSFGESLKGATYFPELPTVGDAVVQTIESGPDQEFNSIRQTIFASIVSAKERLWIATPYFVPDMGIMDAIRFACQRGVDVRLLCPLRSDQLLTHYAGRYYWDELLALGAKIYEYTKGMMHAKTLTVDGRWGMVGSVNMDNRSLHLNFEISCVLHTPDLVKELDEAFQNDLRDSIQVDGPAFAKRPYSTRFLEQASRLFSPIL